jgi:long-chain acyl-CoA synthetase
MIYPDIDVGTLLAGAARRYGEREAVREGAEALSYTELHARSAAFAAGLRAQGITAGDTVALHLPNGLGFPIAYFGTLLAGATACLTNPLQPPDALRAQLTDAGAVAAVTHPAHAATLAAADPPLRFVVEGPLDGGPAVPPPVAPDSVAHLAYTGGTTGTPKAVLVSHRNVVANVLQIANWRTGSVPEPDGHGSVALRPAPDAGARRSGFCGGEAGRLSTAEAYPLGLGRDTAVLVPPLYHAHALIHFGFMLLCGMTVVILGRFDAGRLLDAVQRHRAAYLTGSPAVWHALLAVGDGGRDLSSVTCVVSGSAPLDPPALRGLAGLFPNAVILEGYGLTEATCTTHSNPAGRGARRKPGSVGLPLADTTVEIRAAGTGGGVLGTAETGEIWIRGPQVTGGYRDRPQETAAQFVDGWLDTGDLGHVDDDGFLFVTGRAKDMLIYKGYNIYPRELEDLLRAHPGVVAAAVVGRPAPGVGELPVAFVVADAHQPPTEAGLLHHVAQRVAPYKRLREVHLVDRLPTSHLGKVLKHELRRRLSDER